jgi:hypothetical protein
MAGQSDAYLPTPATQGSTNRRIMVQASSGIKQDPISKTTIKRGWQGASRSSMPSKCEALSSTPHYHHHQQHQQQNYPEGKKKRRTRIKK